MKTAQGQSTQIVYPGIDGIPVRLKPGQDILDFSQITPDKMPQMVSDCSVDVFDLSKPEHMERYRELLDKVAKRRCVISQEERQWDAKKANFVVFVRWLTPYWELRDRPTPIAAEKPPVFDPARPIGLAEAVVLNASGSGEQPESRRKQGVVTLSKGRVKHERRQKIYT